MGSEWSGSSSGVVANKREASERQILRDGTYPLARWLARCWLRGPGREGSGSGSALNVGSARLVHHIGV